VGGGEREEIGMGRREGSRDETKRSNV